MIYPAVVMKVIGFKKKDGSLSRFPVYGVNKILVQLDNGKKIEVDMFSNDKDMNSLFDYLDNKALQGVKENKVKSLALDLVFNPDNEYADLIKTVEDRLVSEGTPLSKAKQEAAIEVVSDIMKEKSLLQSASIFRAALASGNNGYNSKSIYVKTNDSGEKVYSTTGIYSQAQLVNQIPIEISYIFDSEQVAVGFMKVKTSSLINGKQINYLLDHSIRTITESLNRNKKPFMPLFLVQNSGSEFSKLALLFNKINQANKKSKNMLDLSQYNEAKELLEGIKSVLISNNSQYKEVQIELPFLIPNEKFVSSFKSIDEHGKSPLQLMREALVNLNFSKENPQVKYNLKLQILNSYILPLLNAQYSPKLITVYNIPAPNLLGESTSWGFMVDNVDFSKLTMGINDIDTIFNYCSSLIEKGI